MGRWRSICRRDERGEEVWLGYVYKHAPNRSNITNALTLTLATGSYFWGSGESFTGQHSDNTMNGGGITYFADGGTYIGQYKVCMLAIEVIILTPLRRHRFHY